MPWPHFLKKNMLLPRETFASNNSFKTQKYIVSETSVQPSRKLIVDNVERL